MSYDFHELKHTRVADLRKIASETDHPAVKGYTQLNKEQLLKALCEALDVEMHEHHEVKGIDKTAVKKQIRDLKAKRDKALEARDHKELKAVRRRIHGLRRAIRRATV